MPRLRQKENRKKSQWASAPTSLVHVYKSLQITVFCLFLVFWISLGRSIMILRSLGHFTGSLGNLFWGTLGAPLYPLRPLLTLLGLSWGPFLVEFCGSKGRSIMILRSLGHFWGSLGNPWRLSWEALGSLLGGTFGCTSGSLDDLGSLLGPFLGAYPAGSCLSSGHFGRRNRSIPCR